MARSVGRTVVEGPVRLGRVVSRHRNEGPRSPNQSRGPACDGRASDREAAPRIGALGHRALSARRSFSGQAPGQGEDQPLGTVGAGRLSGVSWQGDGTSSVPYTIYTDPEIYRREQDRIFGGPYWSYVGLTAELPDPGDLKTTFIGDRPVVVVRGGDGRIRVLANRCAHRGVVVCRSTFDHVDELVCPYHQWCYDLEGSLVGVPFRRGVKKLGGMPAEFDLAEHGLVSLAVTERNGVVFASFAAAAALPALADELGPEMLRWFDRVFDGRELRVLGFLRQRVRANWKLMFENIKDPYHASLLHVFLVTFGLFRADQPSAVRMDPSGRHAVLISRKGEQQRNETTAQLRSFQADLELADPRLLQPVREYPGEETVVMQTLWPNLIVQQQSNTLATRQLVTRGPSEFDLHWTFFGYEDDDEEMTLRRLRQASLMGPSGLVSIDDSEVIRLAQLGLGSYPEGAAVVEMGGHDTTDTEHMVTETAIRAFYAHYRKVMDL